MSILNRLFGADNHASKFCRSCRNIITVQQNDPSRLTYEVRDSAGGLLYFCSMICLSDWSNYFSDLYRPIDDVNRRAKAQTIVHQLTKSGS